MFFDTAASRVPIFLEVMLRNGSMGIALSSNYTSKEGVLSGERLDWEARQNRRGC